MREIRKAINREFPIRGQSCVCMTRREFDHRWSKVVARLADRWYRRVEHDISSFGRLEILLEPSKLKLMAKIAWVPDDTGYVPKPVRQIIIKPANHTPKPRNDGYDCLRNKEPPKFKWREADK